MKRNMAKNEREKTIKTLSSSSKDNIAATTPHDENIETIAHLSVISLQSWQAQVVSSLRFARITILDASRTFKTRPL